MASTDLLDGLNPEQREAVTTVEGPLLVHAGPGSGKTRVITHRIAYMVREAGINPRHILAVTFSKKAASEMKKRLAVLLPEACSALTVSTIHSACLRILRSEGIEGFGANFEVFDDEAQNKLLKGCLENAGLDPEENDIRRFKGIISYAKTHMINPDAIVPQAGERFDDVSLAVYRSYQRDLKRQHALDYDDMLVFVHRLLGESQAALRKYQRMYRYILVDEFQDTSSLQYQIIKMLGARSRNVCVVGDPDQTIYSWRQAEIRNADRFRKDFPGTKIVGMDENYRSTRNIVDAANALIAGNTHRKEKQLVTSRETGKKLVVVKLDDEDAEAAFIASVIIALTSRREAGLNDFAVLYRVNAQSRALEDEFNRVDMPYILATGVPFYKRKEVLDMTAWLRVMRNPADDVALVRVLRLAGKGIGVRSLAILQSRIQKSGVHLFPVLEQVTAGASPPFSSRARQAIARFLALLQDLRAESRHISLVTLMNRIIEKTDYRGHLKSEDDADERWENVLELISLAAAYEHLSPAEALTSLLQKINAASEAADRNNTTGVITLNTLHGSKGTEFPMVFIAGVEEGLLPHSKSLDDPERLEEERRLCYVGITRAMDRVFLTHTEKRSSFGEASFHVISRFIKELPERLIVRKDLTGTGVPRGYSTPQSNAPDAES